MRGLLGALCALLVVVPCAQARDFSVTSFDGTRIDAHFFPAEATPAPTILIGPGWSGPGATSPDPKLHRAGYNILTWDPRGFGTSGGEANVDSPEYEARDVQALIDYLVEQPEAQLDKPGDPRLGMAGGSYGGGIQWVTAAIDDRVDVIVPEVAWHSLVTSLYKHDTLKIGWGTVLCGAGVAMGIAPGLVHSPVELGHVAPTVFRVCTNGLLTGEVADADRDWFAARGPGDALMERIRIPALVMQGTVDTLFTLDEAIQNVRVLRANGVPHKMMWYCSGHGLCLTDAGPGGYSEQARLRWFDRYLKGDKSVDTGAPFEWIDQHGVWHQAGGYPLEDAGTLEGTGSGSLLVSPVDVSGVAILATSAPNSVKVPIAARAADVVGAPTVELTYSGSGGDVRVFGQIVDKESGRVLGNQATPIPLTLDGAEHTLTQELEAVAHVVTPDSRLELQIAPSSTLYGPQRKVGTVDFKAIKVTLPAGTDPGTPATPAATPRRCTLRPKRARRGARGRIRLRPVVRCAGTRQRVRVRLRAGKRTKRVMSGKRVRIRVGARKRIVARYRVDGKQRRAVIRIRRK